MTSATIATTVISGRLIAKSEMNMAMPSLFHVVRDAHLHRGAGGNAASRAEQNRVARRQATADLHRLGRRVADPQVDLRFLHDAALDAHHERTQSALVDRRDRYDRCGARLARHVTVREQAADEHPALVWQ